ncbi:MAG: 50S ribosomal protein L25 [Planctomycetaceae bacterium]|nr:50S ribosomal protein L25 [Planctomycetaceae bacterium]
MALQLAVESRNLQGKRNSRRLRHSGQIPAILYGHGLECVPLSVASDVLSAAIRHGSRLVQLTGAINESAFIRELQWDTWGTHIVHVDFTRISEHEIVEIRVPVELRGEAPGVREGGVVVQLIHEVEIACPASAIPEKIDVNINHLALEQSVTLASLELPEGAKLTAGDPEDIVVHCIVPVEMPEEGAEAVPGEPEVIGAKAEEGEEEKED